MESHNLCATCLSVDRKLVAVNKLKNNAMFSSYFNKVLLNNMYICWECQALFVKMNKFMAQVIRAQQTLKSWTGQKPEKILSFSSLSVQTITAYNEIYEHGIKTEINDDVDTSHVEFDQSETQINYACATTTNTDIQNITSTYNLAEVKCLDCLAIKVEQTSHLSNTDDGCHESKLNVTCPDINDIKSEGVDSDKNKNRNRGVEKKSYNREKFILFKLSEKEMLKNREIDRDSRRYKACTFRCDKCIMGYYDEEKYERHIKEKHSEQVGKHVCPICEVHFSRSDYYKLHVSAHYRGYKCKLCEYSHHRQSAVLIHHARAHEGETKYVCVVCQEVFDNKRSLRYHRNKVHREVPKCQLCEKTFSSNASLKTHVSTHTVSAAVHPCPSCSRTYKSAASLRAHLRSHAAERDERAYCAPCDKQFRTATLYKRHLAEHKAHVDTNMLKYSCGVCGARFVLKNALRRHVQRRHLKIYPHECTICHKRFAARHILKSHVLHNHEGVPRTKDKICSYCGKGFAKRSSLTNHLRVHTGERPFVCGECGATFTQQGSLNTHTKTKHARLTTQTTNSE